MVTLFNCFIVAFETGKQFNNKALPQFFLPMPQPKIKKVKFEDINELVDISQQTFIETFGAFNTPENMKLYLTNDMSAGSLKAELEKDNSEFYFLIYNHSVTGYMKINYNTSQKELEEFRVIELERIYLLNQYQSIGLGKLLLEKAIAIAHKSNCEYLWLAVWEHNKKAIEFYQRNGFESFSKKKFILGKDVQGDICMKLKV